MTHIRIVYAHDAKLPTYNYVYSLPQVTWLGIIVLVLVLVLVLLWGRRVSATPNTSDRFGNSNWNQY